MKLTKEHLVDAISQTKQYHDEHKSGGGTDVTVENGVLKFSGGGSGPGPGPVPTPKSDIDIGLLYTCSKNGINILLASTGLPLNAYCYEYSAGHEGFSVAFGLLEIGSNYKFSVDHTNVDCQYLSEDWSLGYRISESNVTNWQTDQTGSGPNRFNNIARVPEEQHLEIDFTATKNIMYLVFYCNGYSDNYTNYFKISNLNIAKV